MSSANVTGLQRLRKSLTQLHADSVPSSQRLSLTYFFIGFDSVYTEIFHYTVISGNIFRSYSLFALFHVSSSGLFLPSALVLFSIGVHVCLTELNAKGGFSYMIDDTEISAISEVRLEFEEGDTDSSSINVRNEAESRPNDLKER